MEEIPWLKSHLDVFAYTHSAPGFTTLGGSSLSIILQVQNLSENWSVCFPGNGLRTQWFAFAGQISGFFSNKISSKSLQASMLFISSLLHATETIPKVLFWTELLNLLIL